MANPERHRGGDKTKNKYQMKSKDEIKKGLEQALESARMREKALHDCFYIYFADYFGGKYYVKSKRTGKATEGFSCHESPVQDEPDKYRDITCLHESGNRESVSFRVHFLPGSNKRMDYGETVASMYGSFERLQKERERLEDELAGLDGYYEEMAGLCNAWNAFRKSHSLEFFSELVY